MAGNKINSKTKGREDKGKNNKSGSQVSEESEEIDFSLLRKPISTSVTGFAQARKIFDLATEELKDLLTNECDLLYECKVCRNLFRSLANFISHKRVYCKDKFNASKHGHFINSSSLAEEYFKMKHIEEAYQEAQKETVEIKYEKDRVPMTKDLTTIIEELTNNNGVKEKLLDDVQQVSVKKISSSSVAVFQNVNYDNDSNDHMRDQMHELDELLCQDKAVLQKDGKFTVESSKTDSEAVIQISDDDDDTKESVLKCKICNLTFSTQKTLRFHMKYKHVESRLVYPCPDCIDIFSTCWSVYRHLFRVHRKTAAQIRRLRESIQAKAFRMNNPPAFYEKRKNNLKPVPDKKITEEERLDQENQAWMENLESDSSPRCGGCGRAFLRRAALVAHTNTCVTRGRALRNTIPSNNTTIPAISSTIPAISSTIPAISSTIPATITPAPRDSRIQIQIRKDYNKTGTSTWSKTDNGDKLTLDGSAQTIYKIQKEPIKNTVQEEEKVVLEEATIFLNDEEQDSNDKESLLESPEKSNDSTSVPDPPKPLKKLAFTDQTEKISSNITALKQKIESKAEADMKSLSCKKCDLKFETPHELCEHMANHYNWVCYACKLCNFKNYTFEMLTDHVKTVHKLRGDSDFYFSTIKALDGPEALEISNLNAEKEEMDTSPNSRRPSRCSTDSNRLSDDSVASSVKVEPVGAKKRKSSQLRHSAKKKKAEPESPKASETSLDKAIMHVIFGEDSYSKQLEDTSSDLEELEEKLVKRMSSDSKKPSVATRRPVRNKSKRKNEDFEYDLSNLLKMDAQGYRESQTVTTPKLTQPKKKSSPEITNFQSGNKDINTDFINALLVMSKKSVELSAAHMKPVDMSVFSSQAEQKSTPRFPFVKPKRSPNKDGENSEITVKPLSKLMLPDNTQSTSVPIPETEQKAQTDNHKDTAENQITEIKKSTDTDSDNIPQPLFPVQLHPLINKNLNEFSKAGMKTKVLVIKPINRNKDGVQPLKTPLKFQTIKLKDRKCSESLGEKIKVVKIPAVEQVVHKKSIANTLLKKISLVENADNNKLPAESAVGKKITSENVANKNTEAETVVKQLPVVEPLVNVNSSFKELDITETVSDKDNVVNDFNATNGDVSNESSVEDKTKEVTSETPMSVDES